MSNQLKKLKNINKVFFYNNTKLYCLNSCPKRKNHMLHQLEKSDINFEIVNGFTDNNLLLSSNKNLKSSQINISLGFYKIFEKFYFDNDIKYALICEDDIIFEDNKILNLLNKYCVNNINSDIFIIYGCFLYYCSKKNNDIGTTLLKNTFEFLKCESKFGNPCFIISKNYAKLVLDNFYPINEPFDNYMIRLINNNKINSFYADPFICYELSSGLYEYAYKKEHYELIKNFSFKRLSMISNYTYDNYSYKKYKGNNFGCIMNEFIFNKINYKQITKNNEKHFLLIGSILNHYIVDENSIICGIGIIKNNINLNSIKPLAVIMVRGPYTRDYLIKNNIYCPENYGDVGLLISNIYPKNNIKFQKNKLGIIPHIVDYSHFSELFKNFKNIKVISLDCNNQNFENILDEIYDCEYIISTSLYGIITGHSYKKKVLWLESYKGLFGDNIKFLDYYASLNCFNINPFKYQNFIKLFRENNFIEKIINEIKLFEQPKIDIIEYHKSKMKKLLPFYNNLFNK